jgi:hypothetical protein
MAEHLLCKCEALSSNSSPNKKEITEVILCSSLLHCIGWDIILIFPNTGDFN